ncbi:hypothetical protein Poly30_34200 [Planctomycetes bacterium Poly30]|uniref:Nickel uptake substrate-specific transmembrane region n=1 Tax=Saltatorellus ferox TaxID=2528018 RepID=A0A518EUV7_9BACT|nr:hypothetical protein Poly30_34200 [Planctomycetes bacterium Poly30]
MRSSPQNRAPLVLLALGLLGAAFLLAETEETETLDLSSLATETATDPDIEGVGAAAAGATGDRVSLIPEPDQNAHGSVAPTALETPIETLGVLRGRVLSASSDGRPSSPIAGAQLLYQPLNPSYIGTDERATSVLSTEEGRFELPVQISGTNPLTVTAQGFVPFLTEAGPVDADTDLGDIFLAEAITLEGRVVDLRGRGIEGARILSVDSCADDLSPYRWDVLEHVLAVTGENGTFRVPATARIGQEPRWTLNALHDDYRPAFLQGTVVSTSCEQPPVTIVMENGASIAGVVTGWTDAEPRASGPMVVSVAPRMLMDEIQDRWEDDWFARRVPLRPDGTFVVRGLRRGETLLLSLWTGGPEKSVFTYRRSDWVIGTAEDPPLNSPGLELAYVPPVRIRARFVDDAGRAVERLAIDADPSSLIMAGTEPRLWMQMASFPDGIVEWVCHAGELEEENLFYASVEDEEGRTERSWEGKMPGLAAGASFDFGEVQLSVPEPEPPAEPVPTRTIEIFAMDRHGQPLPRAVIERAAASDPSKWLESTRSDASGRASFEVPPDQASLVRFRVHELREWLCPALRYRAPWAIDSMVPWTLVPQGRESVTLRLESPETAEVRVLVTYGGQPLPGASLVLQWSPPEADLQPTPGYPPDRIPREATPKGRRTDGAGRWTADALVPGDWTAFVYHPRLRMPELFRFTLLRGENEIEFARSQTALKGRVVDDHGAPVPGAAVRADFADRPPVLPIHERDNHRMVGRPGGDKEDLVLRDIRYIRADASGSFRLEGVEPGVELRALAMAPGFVIAASEPVVVEADRTIDLGDLRMKRAGRLQVWLPTGMEGDIDLQQIAEQGPDAETEVQTFPYQRWSSIFDAEVVEGLEPGDWSVKVSYRHSLSSYEDSSYTQHAETIRVGAGKTLLIDLRQ